MSRRFRTAVELHMPRTPVAPPPDTIEPHAPPEAPCTNCPPEQPGPAGPEYTPPPDPTYSPDVAPPETPAPDFDA